MFSSRDDEHPNAWLRYGPADGTMFVLDISHSGRVEFSQWKDTDYHVELAPPVELERVKRQTALILWKALDRGDLECVRRELHAR
ncbi:hypothetical protein F2P44_25895 [Massilia sp. CCM 8695]|uniref:Uncharacterized protein n=1 Tax=Massilia frigida TaxID=2609281 RepID=A0ABX0NHG0_9BURK|nr:hypothetical protein [Massilia frigida]NHZ82684.1 hypothetical protein [Massilia frigida]